MVSKKRPQARQNSGDEVFEGIPVGKKEGGLFAAFLAAHDFSSNSRRAFAQDVRKFAGWFSAANREPFTVGRVTTRDAADFRDHLRREQGQAVATVNRALVTVRRFFDWLTEQGHVANNPAKKVKELKRVALAPKGLDRSHVRRLLREVELRQHIRAAAIFFSETGREAKSRIMLSILPVSSSFSTKSGTRSATNSMSRILPVPQSVGWVSLTVSMYP